MSRGRHFALTELDAERLLRLEGQDQVVALVTDDIEERYLEPWFCDTDKAWDAIHRAMGGDSMLTYDYASTAAEAGRAVCFTAGQ